MLYNQSEFCFTQLYWILSNMMVAERGRCFLKTYFHDMGKSSCSYIQKQSELMYVETKHINYFCRIFSHSLRKEGILQTSSCYLFRLSFVSYFKNFWILELFSKANPQHYQRGGYTVMEDSGYDVSVSKE